MNQEDISAFLDRYGRALSDADLETITTCWAVPSLVLSDNDARAVSDASEVEAFFGQAIQWYRSRGQHSTRPEIQSVGMLGQRVASVAVKWTAFDEAGAEKSTEISHYVLQELDDGRIAIRMAFTEPA